MKKFFQTLGIVIIFLFTFIFSERTTRVVKNLDNLMIEIKENEEKLKTEPIEAIITGNEIIPGKNGKEVDEIASYNVMKKVGLYDQKYIKYKTIEIKNNLENNIDKIIINGNNKNKEIAIIILLENNEKKLNIPNLSYFADGQWIENNPDRLIDGITGYNFIYNSSTPWLAFEIKKERKRYFCLYTNKKSHDICRKNDLYTIKEEIISNNYLIEVKNKIKNGKIFIFKYNQNIEKELELISNYINNKGYTIRNINNLLAE